MRYDTELMASHVVSLLLFGSFAFVAYFTYKLDHRNHLAVGKDDRKRIRIVEALVFFMMMFSIPLGSFIWYYIIRLFQLNLEYLAIISLANLICLFGIVYVTEECSIESDLKNYKSLSRLYSKNESVHAIVKMMVRMTISSFNNLTNSVIILSLIALLLFDLYELRSCIKTKKYLDSTT
jgi:dipeptide/tripeptide permease